MGLSIQGRHKRCYKVDGWGWSESPDRQNQWVYVREEVYHKELAHEMMEADKSQELQLGDWRHSRVCGLAPL